VLTVANDYAFSVLLDQHQAVELVIQNYKYKLMKKWNLPDREVRKRKLVVALDMAHNRVRLCFFDELLPFGTVKDS